MKLGGEKGHGTIHTHQTKIYEREGSGEREEKETFRMRVSRYAMHVALFDTWRRCLMMVAGGSAALDGVLEVCF